MKGKVVGETAIHSCSHCSRCCSYFCMEIDEPETRREYDDLAWIIAHEGVAIHVCDGEWQLIVYNRCRHLLAEGGCAIYEKRPEVCREHEPGDCEADQKHEHDYDDIEHVFTTMDELWEYRKELIRKRRSDGARKAAKSRREAQRRKKEAKADPTIPLATDKVST
jgi:Fe-S-cluster containining protein